LHNIATSLLPASNYLPPNYVDMKAALYSSKNCHDDLQLIKPGAAEDKASLVLCFADKNRLQESNLYAILQPKFPKADIILVSTAGEICDTTVTEESVSVISMEFNKTQICTTTVNITAFENSYEAGKSLVSKLDKKGLRYIMIFSDGQLVNGSRLVQGINEAAAGILVTGGLAGDGNRFQSTLVGVNGIPVEGMVVAIGFYGDHLVVGHGSRGGWETFGLEKTVSRSAVNVLYEIDGKNALGLYKHYLGSDAAALPWAALFYPLAVKLPDTGETVVRTILSIDENEGSMKFAGDIPQGAKVRFMHANFDRLTHAASGAATDSIASTGHTRLPEFALLISCVGRKVIFQARIEDEVEAVDDVFLNNTPIAGFYSYGELSPLIPGNSCQLHNQTMTITTFYELE